ncbi:hypothetical protein MMC13_002906 [Lambiella insularis]|nr:hypothetical protein [Lambiella insularis]
MATVNEPDLSNQAVHMSFSSPKDVIPLIRVTDEAEDNSGFESTTIPHQSHRYMTWPIRQGNPPNTVNESFGHQKNQISTSTTYEVVSGDDDLEHRLPIIPKRSGLSQTIGHSFRRLISLEKLSEWNSDEWIIEWIALFGSFVALGAIVIFLYHFNEHVSSTRFLDLHINSWVSGLSTVSKTLLLFSVGSAIGQQKWLWFRRERALTALDEFDAATRDPKGAIKLLYNYNFSSLASLGALLALLALAMDFSIQNAVSLEVRSATIGTASTKRLKTLYMTFVDDPSEIYEFDPLYGPRMTQALYEGMFGSPLQPSVTCSTGNCTFDNPIASLAVCSLCQNISNHITLYTDLYNNSHSRLPNGMDLQYTTSWGDKDPDHWFVSSANLTLSEGFPHLNSMVNFTALSSNESYECSLFICVNEYKIMVNEGMISENLIRTWNSSYIKTEAGVNDNFLVFQLPKDDHDQAVTPDSAFTIRASLHAASRQFLQSSLTDDLTLSDWVYSDLSPLPALIANITQSISVQLRQDPAAETVEGNALWTDTFIVVLWYWLSFPFALSALSFVFILITVLTTEEDGIGAWKSSLLPLIFHGLSSKLQHEVKAGMKVSEMEKLAGDLKVELLETDEGRRFDSKKSTEV